MEKRNLTMHLTDFEAGYILAIIGQRKNTNPDEKLLINGIREELVKAMLEENN